MTTGMTPDGFSGSGLRCSNKRQAAAREDIPNLTGNFWQHVHTSRNHGGEQERSAPDPHGLGSPEQICRVLAEDELPIADAPTARCQQRN
jgi:hypothetical protein